MRTNDEIMIDRIWDFLVDNAICTDEEIGLAVALCGKNVQTMERVLFIRTGYRSLDQIEGEEED